VAANAALDRACHAVLAALSPTPDPPKQGVLQQVEREKHPVSTGRIYEEQ